MLSANISDLGNTSQMAERLRELRQKRETRESEREMRQRERLLQLDIKDIKDKRDEVERQKILECFIVKSNPTLPGVYSNDRLNTVAVQDLKDETETAKEANGKLQIEKVNLRMAIETLRDKIEDDEESIDTMSRLLAIKLQDIDRMEKEVRKAKAQFQKQQSEMISRLAEPIIIPEESCGDEDSRGNRQGVLEGLRLQIEGIEKEIAQVREVRTNSKQQGQDDTPINASPPLVHCHSKILSTVESEIIVEEGKVALLRQEIECIKNQSEHYDDESSKLRKQIDLVKAEIRASKTSVYNRDSE
eukprot:Ihof_evm1s448 gene=Ihof_evmTU1s448